MTHPGSTLFSARITIAFLAACLMVFSALSPARAQAADAATPSERHEKLTFRLQWGVIPVGFAVLESLPGPNGLRRFVLAARSNSFVDLFVKVRDRIESLCSPDLKRSALYAKDLKEGKYERAFTTKFDWKRRIALRKDAGGKTRSLPLQGNTVDPLSVFYTFREIPLTQGKSLRARVTDGKKMTVARVDVTERKQVRVLGDHFDAWKVEVRMDGVDGIFRMAEGSAFHVWVTADDKQTPVKIESDIIIGGFSGHFVGSLIKSEILPE